MPKVDALPAVPLPAWQKGFPLEKLRAIREVFKFYDFGHCFGAFTPAKENTIAAWLAEDKLRLASAGGQPIAAIVVSRQTAKRQVIGFADLPIGLPNMRACLVKRLAFLPGAVAAAQALVEAEAKGGELWLETWAESAAGLALCDALGCKQAGAKVLAGSEIVGIFCRGARRLCELPAEEEAALCPLAVVIPPELVVAAARACRRAGDFCQHYSSYNKRGSWQALALRGFGGRADFIIKPAEMARKWRAEHLVEMGWECLDTPLRAQLPEIEELVRLIPGEKERIRLMRLAPGGGELTRHADITDPDAGVAPGRLLRIHIPLITNPKVVFTQWLLDGQQKQASMAAGEAWYLDTRKPHTAKNGGETPRLHLVMDVASNNKLLRMLCW